MEQILCPRTCMHIVTQNVQELQYQLLFTGSIGDFLKGDCQALSFHVVYLGLHLGGSGLLHSSSHILGGHFGGLVDRWRTVSGIFFLKELTILPTNPDLYYILYITTIYQFIHLSISSNQTRSTSLWHSWVFMIFPLQPWLINLPGHLDRFDVLTFRTHVAHLASRAPHKET